MKLNSASLTTQEIVKMIARNGRSVRWRKTQRTRFFAVLGMRFIRVNCAFLNSSSTCSQCAWLDLLWRMRVLYKFAIMAVGGHSVTGPGV